MSSQAVILRRVPPDEELALSEAFGRVERDLGGGSWQRVPTTHPPRLVLSEANGSLGPKVLLRMTYWAFSPNRWELSFPYVIGSITTPQGALTHGKTNTHISVGDGFIPSSLQHGIGGIRPVSVLTPFPSPFPFPMDARRLIRPTTRGNEAVRATHPRRNAQITQMDADDFSPSPQISRLGPRPRSK
jgi:hypothetical protein